MCSDLHILRLTASRGIVGSGITIASVPTIARGSTPAIATGITIGRSGAPAIAIVAARTPSAVVTVTRRELLKVGVGLELEVLAGFTLRNIHLKEVGDLLLRLEEGASEDAGNGLVLVSVERCSEAAVTDAASTTCRRYSGQKKVRHKG
jgi:hypothetical protein